MTNRCLPIRLYYGVYYRIIARVKSFKRKRYESPDERKRYMFEPEPSECGKSLAVIYRISDSGYAKVKPAYINNENCLKNAVNIFTTDRCRWVVIADNVCDETYDMICKYVASDNIMRVSVGHGAGTFNIALNIALSFTDNPIVYFLENDYLHRPGADDVLAEGFDTGEAEYVTLYDHPDKYVKGKAWGRDGEKSKVFASKSVKWKTTCSTTMTFAARRSTLFADRSIIRLWTRTKHPYDFYMFRMLGRVAGRTLISPLPSYSTHGETALLAPGIDWKAVAAQS